MESDLHILVINLDNLEFTRNVIADLMKQEDMDYDLTVLDNASVEQGTKEYFKLLKDNGVKTICHEQRVPLCHIWNSFYEENQNKYLCYLNNDIRLCYNYTKVIKQVFEKEPEVKIVCHTTNNPQFKKVSDKLEYKVLFKQCRQGWDFTIRREAYVPIPKEMKIYFGDDWIYANVYKNGGKSAIVLNSPTIHYLGKSVKSLNGNEYYNDEVVFKKLGFNNDYSQWSGYSVGKPHFGIEAFTYESLLTINVVTHERYEQIDVLLRMLANQTDPRFIVDIWQDGKDDRKQELVRSFNDKRFIYNFNEHRQNKYGHDMRHQSIMNCKTKYWCTTNDDNYVSPFFVEVVLKNIDNFNILKYAMAMENIVWGGAPLKWFESKRSILNGIMEPGVYNPHYKVLDPEVNLCGDVDAASFIVETEIIKKNGGWWSMDFSGDWMVFEKMFKSGISIKTVNQVLQVHR